MACPTGKLVVESKDPRINYNLLPGEKLMTCPYNVSHAVLPIKFAKHVFNCHRHHLKEQAAKNAESLFAICQYDRSHHVRKEEIAFHEANCEARLDSDDWGWPDDDQGAACASTSAKAASSNVPKVKVELRKPPPIDKETMEVLENCETWELEKDAPKFDANQRIHELRLGGYKVLRTHDIIGLSKSEKKAFYEKERQALEKYDKMQFKERFRDTCSTVGSTSGASCRSTISSRGSEIGVNELMDELDEIREDESESKEWE